MPEFFAELQQTYPKMRAHVVENPILIFFDSNNNREALSTTLAFES